MELTQLLPVAVKEDKSRLPPELLEEIKPLKARRPARFFLELAYCWMVVFGVITAAVYMDHWLATIFAIFIVATRQNVLALLTHEQTHCTALKVYPGDLLVNLFATYPLLLLTVEGYAQVHLQHHAKYFTEDDPDHRRKSGEDWNYPMKPLKFIKILLGDISALSVIGLIRGKKGNSRDTRFSRQNHIPPWVRPGYYLTLAAVLTVTGTWGIFLLYWVLPLFTIFQIFVRWGAVCEHQYNRLGASVQATSPLIILNRWERILLPNLNFTYHIYHHYFPSVSFSQLPKVHDAFVRHGLVDDSAVFYGYWSYLTFMLRPGVTNTMAETYTRKAL